MRCSYLLLCVLSRKIPLGVRCAFLSHTAIVFHVAVVAGLRFENLSAALALEGVHDILCALTDIC